MTTDVVYPTKVRIFQQITTGSPFGYYSQKMLFTLQRYEFFSKSQHTNNNNLKHYRCCLPYKGTNFSANHNRHRRKWHQDLMLFTLQRYEFFSKSQLRAVSSSRMAWCCLPYKGTNFSANHNNTFYEEYSNVDVVYPTKVRIFQQITTWVTAFYTVTCNKQI